MPAAIYVFDAYGTLFDVHSAIGKHRDKVGPDADRMSEVWRTKQLEYSWTLTLSGQYQDFWALTGQALDFALARFPSVDKGLKPQLMDAYYKLGAFPDAKDTLRRLRDKGCRTGILSNGSPAMLKGAVEAAGLGDLLDAVLSIDSLKMFKPRPEVYDLVINFFRCRHDEVAFISSNRWDVMGAANVGFKPVWINRAGNPDEYGKAERVVTSLSALPDLAV